MLDSYLDSRAPSGSTIPTETPAPPQAAKTVQHAVSARIVQVLLEVLAFCAFVGLLHRDSRRISVKHSCSIAIVHFC